MLARLLHVDVDYVQQVRNVRGARYFSSKAIASYNNDDHGSLIQKKKDHAPRHTLGVVSCFHQRASY